MFCTCTIVDKNIHHTIYITVQYSTVSTDSIHVQYCQHLSQVLLTFFCACEHARIDGIQSEGSHELHVCHGE